MKKQILLMAALLIADISLFAQSGNTGIGISVPTAKLHVNGDVKITDGTQGANKVLTSDANGLASWQPNVFNTSGQTMGTPYVNATGGADISWNSGAGWTAGRQGCSSRLDWSTATEHNNDHFIVERSSDGKVFTHIATIAGAGNSHASRYYHYVDEAPLQGLNYYRIAQVDRDGKSATTAMQLLRFDCGNTMVKLYPTPTKDVLQVVLPESYERAVISLYTLSGQPVIVPGAGKAEGSGLHTLQLNGIAKATYILKVRSGTDAVAFKVIVE